MSQPIASTDAPLTLSAHAPLARLRCNHAEPQIAETSQPVTLIGSRRGCGVYVNHGDVSKVHAAICNTGRELILCDLRSRTGTFVNGQRVTVRRLVAGDVVRVAGFEIAVEFERPGAASAESRPAEPTDDPAIRLASPIAVQVNGARVELATQPALFGRRNNCDIVIDTPDVSLAHTLLFDLDETPVVFDLGSRSGTLINGKRVDIAALSPGDKLVIGGETLEVAWTPPARPQQAAAIAAEPEAEPALDTPIGQTLEEMVAGLTAASGVSPQGSGDAFGLEQTIVTLQSQVLGFRKQLDHRAAELHRREQNIAELAQTLERKEADIEALAATLADDRAALEAEQHEVLRAREHLRQLSDRSEKRRQTLLISARACREQKRRIITEQAQLEEAKKAFAATQQEMVDARKALELERAAFAASQAELARHQQELARERKAAEARAADLAKRSAALDQRELDLAAREAASEETARKIQQIKSALENASNAFAGMSMQSGTAKPAAAPPTPTATPRSAKSAPKQSRNTGPSRVGGHDRAQARDEASPGGPAAEEKLPAPMVTEPIFGGASLRAADLPAEMQERLRVLRRVSQKSDQELLAQVVAEMEARQREAEPQPTKGDKRKRAWWS